MASERRGKPTIYDVAKRVGVSTATISRSLNGTGQIAFQQAAGETVGQLLINRCIGGPCLHDG